MKGQRSSTLAPSRPGRDGCAAALVPCLLLGLACGSDAEPGEGSGGDGAAAPVSLPAFAGCEREFHGACEVLDTTCQERLFSTARCLRHQPDAVLPEVRVISKQDLVAEIATERARATEASGQDALSEMAANQVLSRALVLLGLAQQEELSDESFDQVFIDTVPAYYSDALHQITIVDGGADTAGTRAVGTRAAAADAASKSLTLLHELVHALQDQDRSLADLNADDAPSFDAYLAALSVAEGEATMLEGFVDAAEWGFEQDPDFRSYFTGWLPAAEQQFAGQSPLLVSPRYFPYSYGARFVFDVFESEGMAGVRALFSAPPSSVLPMLLNADGLVDTEPESMSDLAEPEPPAGFVLHEPDRFGPWVFGKFLERVLPDVANSDLPKHWRGDRALVWESTDQGIAAAWTIRLDSEAAAGELFEPLRQRTLEGAPSANAFCLRSGRDVTLGLTDIASTRDLWITALGGAE